MTRKKTYKQVAISPELHRDIAVTAAKEGTSMKELAERLFRLGLVAGDLAAALEEIIRLMPDQRVGQAAMATLAAYDKAAAGNSRKATP